LIYGARRLPARSDFGFESQIGGSYDSGAFSASADRKDNVWWVQSEALVRERAETRRGSGERATQNGRALIECIEA